MDITFIIDKFNRLRWIPSILMLANGYCSTSSRALKLIVDYLEFKI